MATATTAAGKKAGAGKKGKTKAAEAGGDPLVTVGGKAVNELALRAAVEKYAAGHTDAAAAKALLAELEGADGPKLVKLVRSHLEATLPAVKEEDRLKCEECGEISTEETDFCPFCGDGGLPALEGEGQVDAETSTASEAVDRGEDGGEPGTAIETATDAAIEAKLEELDAAVSKIRELQIQGAHALYDLGVEIRKVATAELWKARGHASFKDWVETETGISRASAYSLMDIVKDFDRETYARIGRTKLALVASIKDPDKRAEALEAAKSGASARELERAKREEGDGDEAPEKEKSDRKTPAKSSGFSLVAKVDGKPVVHSFRSPSSGRPVKVAKEDSYVEIPIAEGVVQRITIKRDEKGEAVGLVTVFVKVED